MNTEDNQNIEENSEDISIKTNETQEEIKEEVKNEIKEEKASKFEFSVWSVMSIISFVVSGFMIYKGYDKFANYTNIEGYSSISVNAYVGGDAYNYIINSNYATGFYVLATLFTILGIGFLIIHFLNKKN